MNEAFETNGFWWLPQTPQTQVPGILSFSPGDVLRLKLMGALNKTREEDFPPPDYINPEIVHGISSKGESVTLYKCLQKSGNSSIGDAGSYYATEFIAHVSFFGAYFPTRAEIQFIGLSVRFHNLDSWYNKNCIQSTTPEPGTEVITFKRPLPIDIQLNDFQFQFAILERRSHKFGSVSMSADAWILISTESPKLLDDYLNLLRLIQNFLTFAITEPTFVIEMNGRLIDTIGSTDEKITPPTNIKIYYAAAGWQPDAREVFWADMLLPYSEIEGNLPERLKEWVDKSEIIKPVYDLYFAGLYKSTYQENEFLNLTQAIETYHRRIYGVEYQKNEIFLNGVYQTLTAAIPPDVPNDFRSSLKSKLMYAHEYSLRKRIHLLSEHISENISIGFLRDKQIRVAFAERIVDTRNYLTHYSPELKDKAITSGEGLFELNQQLGLILKICLLEEIGIPFAKIITLLKRDRSYQKYLN